MARAAVKAKQQARAKAQPAKQPRARGRKRHAGGGNPNQQLFFMRLRRRQKWVFLALAIIFAATFAGVGVGSGSGSGLDQLYSGIFGGGGDSVSKAQAEIKKDPAKGYRDLAQAYETKGNNAGAISALQSYVGLKKNDANAWTELGGLEQTQAQAYATQYQQAQSASQISDPGAAFQPGGSLAQFWGTNPATQASSQQATTQLTQLSQQMTGAYTAAMTAYQTVARLQPHNAQAQFALANSAQFTGQYSVELTALKRYLVLDPQSPYRKQVASAVKQLEKSLAPAKHK